LCSKFSAAIADQNKVESLAKLLCHSFFGTRASCHHFLSNWLRALLTGLAYTLMQRFKELALKGTELERASSASIRVRLLKMGAGDYSQYPAHPAVAGRSASLATRVRESGVGAVGITRRQCVPGTLTSGGGKGALCLKSTHTACERTKNKGRTTEPLAKLPRLLLTIITA